MGHEVEKINANTDEREFINRLKAGDKGAFEQFVLENQRLVFSYCLSRLPSREDAEDVAQESFLRAFKSISSFRAEASLLGFLQKEKDRQFFLRCLYGRGWGFALGESIAF